MTNPIVISFYEDGSVEYTRNKDFMPFDGAGEMQRVTDIKKSPSGNEYYIHWMLGPFAGQNHTYKCLREYDPWMKISMTLETKSGTIHHESSTIMFSSYEAAVAHEVAMLNAMRRQGIRFHNTEA